MRSGDRVPRKGVELFYDRYSTHGRDKKGSCPLERVPRTRPSTPRRLGGRNFLSKGLPRIPLDLPLRYYESVEIAVSLTSTSGPLTAP